LLLAAQGLARIVYTTKGDNPAFERQSTLIADDAFVVAHPDLTQKIVTALVKAADWSSQEQNRDALFEVWARSGRPASVYKADFKGQTLKYRNSPLIDAYLVEAHRTQARQAKEHGLIQREVSVDGWFDSQSWTWR
jgi:sulfonate transport system substrate-binding protein